MKANTVKNRIMVSFCPKLNAYAGIYSTVLFFRNIDIYYMI